MENGSIIFWIDVDFISVMSIFCDEYFINLYGMHTYQFFPSYIEISSLDTFSQDDISWLNVTNKLIQAPCIGFVRKLTTPDCCSV